MNDGNLSIRNLAANLTKKQKIGIGVFLVIVTIVAMVIAASINSLQDGLNNSDAAISEAVNWDDGSTAEVPVSTDYNEDYTYPLIDYLPASRFSYLEYGDGESGTRTYWWIMENTATNKGLVISADSCDVEGNTKAALEYLKNLPVNLGGYTVVYQVHTSDVPCEVE